MRRLLTSREICEQLSISQPTLSRWVKNKNIPVVRFPKGTVRFDPERIEAWLKVRTIKADIAGKLI